MHTHARPPHHTLTDTHSETGGRISQAFFIRAKPEPRVSCCSKTPLKLECGSETAKFTLYLLSQFLGSLILMQEAL